MAAIQFYQLLTAPLDRALPKLLEKAHGAGFRVVVVAGSEELAEHLNQWLWTYDPGSFLPHGSLVEGDAEKQPILISTEFSTANGATLAAVVSGSTPPQPDTFERILDIFDGNDPHALESARQRWKEYKLQGHTMSYLKQTDTGGWEQKAIA